MSKKLNLIKKRPRLNVIKNNLVVDIPIRIIRRRRVFYVPNKVSEKELQENIHRAIAYIKNFFEYHMLKNNNLRFVLNSIRRFFLTKEPFNTALCAFANMACSYSHFNDIEKNLKIYKDTTQLLDKLIDYRSIIVKINNICAVYVRKNERVMC